MNPGLRALYDAGREAWPDIDVSFERFAELVGGETTEGLDGAGLYLACACAGGDDRAAARFTEVFGRDLERAAERVRAPGISPEDARQMLLHRILVGDEERRPKIAGYQGRGSLRNWVRAVAARAAIDLHRRGGDRERSASDSLFDKLIDSADPEVEYLKQHYRAEFSRAFETAVEGLPPRARNYLRHAFIDRLTIDQVAALYGIHRSTAARRLAAARDALFEATRAALIDQLEISAEELDSIMRLIGSRLDVSVQRIFSD